MLKPSDLFEGKTIFVTGGAGAVSGNLVYSTLMH